MFRIRLGTTLLLVAVVTVGIGWYVEIRRRPVLDAEIQAARAEMSALSDVLSTKREWGLVQPGSIRQGWEALAEPEDLADREALRGTWELVAPEDGKARPARMTLQGDEVITPSERGQPPLRRYFRTVRLRDGLGIDETTGDIHRPVRKGLYRLEGDRLTIGWGRDGTRPRRLDAKSAQSILIYKKVTP